MKKGPALLLRSITKHVKDQNWFAVFLDFFIVIIGILIAFQITNWNENRREHNNAKQYLQRLVTDMDISIARNDEQLKTALGQLEDYNVVLTALDACQLQQADEIAFVTGIYDLGKTNIPTMVMGTIEELNSTGNFPLIGDLSLRRMITESVRKHQTVLAIDEQIIARSMPSINYTRTRVRFNIEQHYHNSGDINPADVAYNLEDLCADSKFIHAIAAVKEMARANIAYTEARRDDQIQVKEALERKLRND